MYQRRALRSPPLFFELRRRCHVAFPRRNDVRLSTPRSSKLTVRRGTIGILRDGERYLLIKRAAHLPKGGKWCFPGGHVEPGETSRIAIVREVAEELGIQAVPRQRLGAVRTPDGAYILVVWLLYHQATTLRLCQAEVADAKWLTLREIETHPGGLSTNEQVLKLITLSESTDAGKT